MEECPICLEPLLGTVVHLGCCKKQVHIQCYISRCPMCRAELPEPPFSTSQHLIVPIPVPYVRPELPPWKKGLISAACCLGVLTPFVVFFAPTFKRG